METFRVERDGNYTTINNEVFKNTNLSLRAKGLFSLIMSLPNDWDFSVMGIVALSKEGRDAVYASLGELIDSGYCHKIQRRKDGKIEKTDYFFFESKELSNNFLLPEKPDTVSPDTVNPLQLNTYSNKELNNKILFDSDSQLPLNIPKEKEEKPTKEESRVDWVLLIEHFNRVTGKKTKVISDKAKKQVLSLLKSGYTKEDLAAGIKNCYEDPFHKENNHKHLTLEFISRPDKMEKYHYVKPTSQSREKGSL